jgi:hypothetical protein
MAKAKGTLSTNGKKTHVAQFEHEGSGPAPHHFDLSS